MSLESYLSPTNVMSSKKNLPRYYTREVASSHLPCIYLPDVKAKAVVMQFVGNSEEGATGCVAASAKSYRVANVCRGNRERKRTCASILFFFARHQRVYRKWETKGWKGGFPQLSSRWLARRSTFVRQYVRAVCTHGHLYV